MGARRREVSRKARREEGAARLLSGSADVELVAGDESRRGRRFGLESTPDAAAGEDVVGHSGVRGSPVVVATATRSSVIVSISGACGSLHSSGVGDEPMRDASPRDLHCDRDPRHQRWPLGSFLFRGCWSPALQGRLFAHSLTGVAGEPVNLAARIHRFRRLRLVDDSVRSAEPIGSTLAAVLRRRLLEEGYEHLEPSIGGLSVVDRCDCGKRGCQSFYTVSERQARRLWRKDGRTIPLGAGLSIDVVGGLIIAVEVVEPDLNA